MTHNFSQFNDVKQEFDALVEEISRLGFTHSRQVSDYIVRNKLGMKYKNISGHLTMRRAGDTWGFDGGFPPDIYAKLCNRLGLQNQGTEAQAVRFKSFRQMDDGK